ncbi:hypothetical protein V6N13_015557 [Hibiscus sabdariffa]
MVPLPEASDVEGAAEEPPRSRRCQRNSDKANVTRSDYLVVNVRIVFGAGAGPGPGPVGSDPVKPRAKIVGGLNLRRR